MDHQQGEVGSRLIHCPKIKTEHVSGSVTGHIPSSSKGKTGKKTVMEDMEDDIDELPDSDFSRATVRLFYEIDNGKAC